MLLWCKPVATGPGWTDRAFAQKGARTHIAASPLSFPASVFFSLHLPGLIMSGSTFVNNNPYFYTHEAYIPGPEPPCWLLGPIPGSLCFLGTTNSAHHQTLHCHVDLIPYPVIKEVWVKRSATCWASWFSANSRQPPHSQLIPWKMWTSKRPKQVQEFLSQDTPLNV